MLCAAAGHAFGCGQSPEFMQGLHVVPLLEFGWQRDHHGCGGSGSEIPLPISRSFAELDVEAEPEDARISSSGGGGARSIAAITAAGYAALLGVAQAIMIPPVQQSSPAEIDGRSSERLAIARGEVKP
eukprot:SAG11_NODE_83_length_17378_cov_5.388622_11_plen_128_part_00